MKKKFLAFFLAACMVIQPMGSAVYASEAVAATEQAAETEADTSKAAPGEKESTAVSEEAAQEPEQPEADPAGGSGPEETGAAGTESSPETDMAGTGTPETESMPQTENVPAESGTETGNAPESGSVEEGTEETVTGSIPETETGIGEAGTEETGTEDVTETETETATETVNEEEVVLGNYQSLDESVSLYVWQDLTVTAGSGMVFLDYYTEANPWTMYLIYTTDGSKDFWPDQGFITQDDYYVLEENGYENQAFSANFDWQNGKYHVTKCLTGFEPETTYYFRAAMGQYTSEGYRYFFLTETESFMTKAEPEESRISISNLKVDEVGYAAAAISFTWNNPELESVDSLELVDEKGDSLVTFYPDDYNTGMQVSMEKYLALKDVEEVNRVKVRASKGEGSLIESDLVEISAKDKEGFAPKAEITVAGRTARFQITVDDWVDADSGAIRAILSYQKKDDPESVQERETYLYEDTEIELPDLEENTEYLWSVRYETEYGQSLFEDKGGSFLVETEVTYTEADIPDAALRAAIQSRIGSGKQLTNTNLAKVTYLNISNTSGELVKDLEGIQYLVNLTSLNIRNQEITSADQVKQLKNLTDLSLDSNDLAGMPDLSGNTKLTNINLDYNLIPASEITQEKLPEAFAQKNPGWVAKTAENQRAPFSTRTSDTYYATGDTFPFIVEISGIKVSQNYTLQATVDGNTWSASAYLGPYSVASLIVVKGMDIDTSGGETKTVTYSLTGADGRVYEDSKEVTCKFAKDTGSGGMNYAKSTDSSISCKVKLVTEDYETVGQVTGMEITKDGERLGTSSYINSYQVNYDDRYASVFGNSWIDTGYRVLEVSGSVALARYLKAGEYDLKVVGSNGEKTLANALTVTGGCVVESVYTYTEVDSSGDYVYVQMEGCNVDPEKIHPVFRSKTGGEILEYVGVVTPAGDHFYGEDSVIYKYRKLGSIWTTEYSVDAVWSLQAEQGYEYTDIATSHSIGFYSGTPILMAHYNYKKGMLEVKLASMVPEGTEVKITLADSAYLDDNNTVVYGSGSAKAVKNWAAVKLLDDNGETYVPVRNSWVYVHIACSGAYEGEWCNGETIEWYNYTETGTSSQNYISTTPIRTSDKKVSAIVITKLEEGTTARLRVYEGKEVALEQDVKVGKNGRIDTELVLQETLSEGAHTIQLMVDGSVYVAGQLAVYDNSSFYMDGQYGTIYRDSKRLEVNFNSNQVYGENRRGSGGTDFYNAKDYEVTLYDRAGNKVKSVTPNQAARSGTSVNTVKLVLENVPLDVYIGLYVKVAWKGQLGKMSMKPSTTYYGSGNYNCDPEYGVWMEDSGNHFFFYTDDTTSHGYYGVGGYTTEEYPLTIKVYEQSTDNLLKQFGMSSGTTYFSSDNLDGLDEDTVYDIAATGKSGKLLASATGYLVCRQEPVAVTGIKLNKSKLTLTLEEGSNTETLEVTYSPANANTGKAITWSSSNEEVVTVANGVVTAVGAGSATIGAVTANGKTATCSVQVFDYSLNEKELTLNVGDTVQLQATDGIKVQAASWSSSDTAVATVSSKGAVEAVGKGKAVITAKLSGGITLTCQVTVNDELKSITFQKTEAVLEVGDSDSLTLIYIPATEAESSEVEWTSSDTAVVTVEEGVVTALKEGSAEITAATVTPSGRKLEAKCVYTVKTPDEVKPVEDGFCVYALTNLDTTLEALEEQLPEKWQWAAPETKLAQFAGMLEKDFAVKHVNENTGAVTYDTVTVKLSTIRNLSLENIPAKLATGEGRITISADYEVDGEQFANWPEAPELTWSFALAKKAKTGIIDFADESPAEGTIAVSALKAGSTSIQATLFADGREIASVTQKITTVDSSRTGIAKVSVKLVDVSGNDIPLTDVSGNDVPALVDVSGNDIPRKDGVYIVQANSLVYLKNDTPVSETGKTFKITYKSSDTSVAKVGAAEKTDKTRTKLTAGKAGLAVITATADDAVKSTQEIRIMVEDWTDKSVDISATSVTFNTALLDPDTELYVSNGFGATLTGAEVDKPEICRVAAYDGAGAVTLAPGDSGKGGSVKLTVSVEKNGAVIRKTFTIRVSLTKKAPSVTVKQIKKVNTFYKDSWGLLSVGATGETIEDVTIKEDGFGYEYEYSTGILKVSDADKLANKKCTLVIQAAGYKPVEKALTIGTETASLALSASSGTVYGGSLMTVKAQVMDKSTKTAISLNGAQANITGGNAENYSVKVEKDALVLTAKTVPAKSEKLSLTVSNPAKWNETRSFTFTVKGAQASKASLQLGTKTLTLYNYGMMADGKSNSVSTALTLNGGNDAAELLKNVQISAADKKTQGVLNQTLVVGYDAESGQLCAKLNGDGPAAGTYKCNLTLQDSLFTKPLKATVSIKVVKVADMSKCVKVTAKGTIDVLNRDGTNVVATPKFSNIAADAKVSSISLTGKDAHLFEIVDRNGNAATLQLKDSVNVITKYKYEVSLSYKLEAGGISFTVQSAPIGIKLTQGKPKVVAKGANSFSGKTKASETKYIHFTVTNSMGERISVSDVRLVNFNKDFTYDYRTGALTHKLNGETVRGKSYTLKFEVYPADRGDNEKPVTVTWKVQIK